MNIVIGVTIGRYAILEEIGSGGMASVYRSMDTNLGREVAIKVLHPHLSRNVEARARFNREAKAVAALRHPNIIDLYDYSGPESQQLYIVMEFVDGKNLGEFLFMLRRDPRRGDAVQTGIFQEKGEGLLPEITAMIALDVCEALEHAHSHGVIHRDLKPENILIGKGGVVKVADFGIARVFSEDRMTQTGALVGSLSYMSPEQGEGKNVDHRSDIFSLGSLMYRMMTGRGPFDAATTSLTLKNLLEGIYPDPRAFTPSVSREFQEIIRRCLHREPRDRFQMISEVTAELKKNLSEFGLTDVDEEIRRFCLSPRTYEEHLKDTVAARLIDRAKIRLQINHDADALDDLNMVLALNGSNNDVGEILERIKRKRRRKELARWFALRAFPGVLLIIIGIAGLWDIRRRSSGLGSLLEWVFSHETFTAPPPAEVPDRKDRENSGTGGIARTSPGQKKDIPVPPSSSQREPPRQKGTRMARKDTSRGLMPVRGQSTRPAVQAGPVPASHAKTETIFKETKGAIDILASPWARVFIDDQYMGNTPIQRRFPISSGEHTVSLQNPLCETYSEKIRIEPGQTFSRVISLKFLPGILTIRIDPDAGLLVDEKEVAVSGGQVRLRLPSGSHSLRATYPQAGNIDMSIDLVPGETKELDLRRK